jgi:HSP20 family molecular chaperone IbpA
MSANKQMESRKSEMTYENGEPTRSGKVFVPYTDIVDCGDEILVIADVPGVDEKAVEVTLDKNLLTIFAAPPVEKIEKYSLSFGEYVVGDFERKFVLSEEVNRDQINAHVKNGVLTVHLPKAGPSKSRKIEVRSL